MKNVAMFLMCLLAILGAGTSLKAQEVTITLNSGWNWISYPNAMAMDVSEAFGDFIPMAGDIVKSRLGSSTYINGQWRGGVSQFTPGWGYMYYSSRIESISFVFAQSTSSFVVTDIPTNITTTSAVVGGTVTLAEGNHIFARGVCWGTEPNPDIDGNHLAGDNVAGSQSFTLDGLNIGTIYYVRAYAATDNGLAYGEELSFTTEDGSGDHDYVDLGLPSGLLWATCNVGANAPEGYGDYFAWGETQPKEYYGWSTYQHCHGSSTSLTKYCSNPSYGYYGFTDSLTTLLPEDDAATANWGIDWRMPTREEWEELYNNTTITEIVQNGVNGCLFTASNGNSLFLPNAGSYGNYEEGGWMEKSKSVFLPDAGNSYYRGYDDGNMYWSSSLESANYPHYAYSFEPIIWSYTDNGNRPYGLPVRAVRSFGQSNAPAGAINGKFTINEDGDQVYFSQGNLQYQASTDTWRFAENQWDYVGEDNSNISQTYDGWIDLFGWGTSSFHNPSDPYNVYYQPWSTSDSEVNGEYNDYGYGPSMNMLDPCLTGTSANYDWGVYNSISNGGNAVNTWRTLTQPEWAYILNTRSTASGIRFAKAQVSDVNGVILLPDDWIADIYNLSNTNSISASFNSNMLSASQWSAIESVGGIFLPTAGGRYGTTVGDVGSRGFYWLSSSNSSCCAYYVYIYDSGIYLVNYKRYLGRSVRLVCPAA